MTRFRPLAQPAHVLYPDSEVAKSEADVISGHNGIPGKLSCDFTLLLFKNPTLPPANASVLSFSSQITYIWWTQEGMLS